MTKLRPLLVLGTRPEAIKMAPLVHECRQRTNEIAPLVCFTGQHTDLLRQVTDYFQITPDIELHVMSPGQSLSRLTARLLTELDSCLESHQPDCVVAQGDTVSVLAAAMTAFFRHVPFVHVEAGLRTGDLQRPWPEEYNRRVTGLTTALHCAPTAGAAENLLREGVSPTTVRVTGNTVIDALLWAARRESERDDHWAARHGYLHECPLVLVTTHRRENHGDGLASVCRAVARLAKLHRQTYFVFPLHPHPQVRAAAAEYLAECENVRLIDPLPYPEFVWMMRRATLILSDSGGVQEEAPSLRKPVLALRETTERPESVTCGAVELVGTDEERIVARTTELLTRPAAYQAMQIARSPYGDGTAAVAIIDWMLSELSARSR